MVLLTTVEALIRALTVELGKRLRHPEHNGSSKTEKPLTNYDVSPKKWG